MIAGIIVFAALIILIFLVIWLMRYRQIWSKIQAILDVITRKWWFFLVVCLLFFLPSYSSQPYASEEIPALIIEVLSQAFVYNYSFLFPVFKIIPILLILGIIVLGGRITRLFDIYVALNITIFAALQNSAISESYGFAIITSNVVVYLLVALFWWWESLVKRNDFSSQKRSLWRYWVVPVAGLAFWFPANPETMTPDFNPLLLLTNEAGLVGCMMIPVYLAVLTLFYPQVNMAAMRVTSFAGMITALFNLFQWFVFYPQAKWMGVLHLPLLSICAYALTLSLRRVDLNFVSENTQSSTRFNQDTI